MIKLCNKEEHDEDTVECSWCKEVTEDDRNKNERKNIK